MLMSSQSKFSTLFVFSCAEMYICISKVLGKRQNRACNFLSSVIMKKRWIVAASSYSCIQGLRRSVLFSFLNRWAWIGWSTLNNKQMLLVFLKILAMRRGEARESGRFFLLTLTVWKLLMASGCFMHLQNSATLTDTLWNIRLHFRLKACAVFSNTRDTVSHYRQEEARLGKRYSSVFFSFSPLFSAFY